MKHDYGVEDPEGKVCWQVLQRGLTERCAFCPVDELLSCGDEVPLVEWDEESPMTGRTYRNYDSLVTWVDGRVCFAAVGGHHGARFCEHRRTDRDAVAPSR